MTPRFTFPTIARENKLSDMLGLISMRSLASGFILILIVYAFFSGIMTQFYASAVFGFYSLTHSMWISVVMLGVFQTVILIPLRILRVRRSQNIEEFQEETEGLPHSFLQQKKLKQQFDFGNSTFLFYLVDFMIQLTTFLSIGRLFLKDFYATPLNPDWLYSFIPYPDYPILDRMFQIPYPVVTKTHNFGFSGMLVLLVLFAAVMIGLEMFRRWKKKKRAAAYRSELPARYFVTYAVFIFIASWFLATHFPVGFGLRIFSGDVALPNPQLNTVTAVVTFLTLLWFGYQRIRRDSGMAREAGIPEHKIEATEKRLFADSVKTATLVGLGAYFITNHIPSAFELSVFTLEVISLSSPFTLDKLVVRANKKQAKPEVEQPSGVQDTPVVEGEIVVEKSH